MKKTIGVTIGVLVVVALALVIIPTTRDEIHWYWASLKDGTASYEVYVKTWPAGRHAAEAQMRYDEHDWADAQAANTVQAFERYVQLHGEGKHIAEAKDNIESLLSDDTVFLQAKQNGTAEALRAFLADFPGHKRETEARAALNEVAKAKVVLDYPKAVHAGASPYSNVLGPIYKWDTTFRETGGHTGFKLKATGFYIRNPSGGKWSNNWSESVEVRSGGTATIEYWCDKSDKWSGGTYHTVWVGKDDLGNSIRIVQEVKLESGKGWEGWDHILGEGWDH